MTEIARTRHSPTPRNPGIPPTMRVAVEVVFVQTCPDCRGIVSELAASCISDPTVTAFRLVPGRKHAHEVTEGAAALPGLATVKSEPTPATSDTNGSDPEAVERELFAHHATANGFDPEGRA